MAKKEDVTWKELKPGVCVEDAGGAMEYLTGDWKSRRPVLDKSKCTKCGLCFLYCPEGCIKEQDDGFFVADLSYCKGCAICSVECPTKAIGMTTEGE